MRVVESFDRSNWVALPQKTDMVRSHRVGGEQNVEVFNGAKKSPRNVLELGFIATNVIGPEYIIDW